MERATIKSSEGLLRPHIEICTRGHARQNHSRIIFQSPTSFTALWIERMLLVDHLRGSIKSASQVQPLVQNDLMDIEVTVSDCLNRGSAFRLLLEVFKT